MMRFVNESEHKNNSGIYGIRNKNTGYVYVGQTRQPFVKRFMHHRWQLRRNNHDNEWLQASFNKHGEDNFEFFIIECINNFDELDDAEIKYINEYKELNKSYNMLTGGGGRPGMPLSEFRRKELGELNRKLNTGKKASEETKQKMSEIKKGVKRKPEDMRKMVDTKSKKLLAGETNKLTKLTADKVSEIKILIMNQVPYYEIAKQYNVSLSNINAIRSNRSWTFVEVDGWNEYCKTRHGSNGSNWKASKAIP